MGFLIQCDNAKCREYQEPALNPDTDEVHCSKCDGVIKHVSIFTKRQMRTMGQVKKESAPKQAFSIKCENCEKILCPSLVEEGGKTTLHCPMCGAEHTKMSAPYKQTVIAFLKQAL